MKAEVIATYVVKTLINNPRLVLNSQFWKLTDTEPTMDFVKELESYLNPSLYRVTTEHKPETNVTNVVIVRMFSTKD
jgi:hypothetical protein